MSNNIGIVLTIIIPVVLIWYTFIFGDIKFTALTGTFLLFILVSGLILNQNLLIYSLSNQMVSLEMVMFNISYVLGINGYPCGLFG